MTYSFSLMPLLMTYSFSLMTPLCLCGFGHHGISLWYVHSTHIRATSGLLLATYYTKFLCSLWMMVACDSELDVEKEQIASASNEYILSS